MTHPDSTRPATDRRQFLQSSTAALIAGSLTGTLAMSRSAHAAGSDVLKIGLIGCGGRGTGAAGNALSADKNVKLTHIADAFADHIESSIKNLSKKHADKIDVPAENRFVGFDAYKQLLQTDVDVVLLTTPPHFRPIHLQAAIDAGKHVFAEKPVAVDAAGVRAVMESCEQAKKKGLSVVSGLCYRYDLPKRELMQRVHDGAIGDILAMHVTYNTNTLWMKPREPQWSDMEWQLRNWLYFTWLSGDHNVEQHIHSLDKAAWAMQDVPPAKAMGLGGRQVRTQPEYGHIYDHHAVAYEYESGCKLFSFCRQMAGCAVDVSDYLIGNKGTAEVMPKLQITGDQKWVYPRSAPAPNMYQQEHDELFAGIRSGNPLNNGEYMTRSTLMAIMGRMATYSGQEVTWEQALNSNEQLGPGEYSWGDLPVPPVAMPGLTPLV